MEDLGIDGEYENAPQNKYAWTVVDGMNWVHMVEGRTH
jgi:hypothetical protein